MPTINYEVETRCFNCGKEQETDLPRNHSFVPYNPSGTLQGSHYWHKYRKKRVEKKCWNCREAKLIPTHLWDFITRRVYES